MLQTRNGKRTPAAALKIACDLVDEGMIDEKQAVAMIEPRSLDTLLHPQFDAEALKKTACHRLVLWPPLPAPPPARSSSPLRTPRSGPPGARRWSWSAWRPLPRISRA